MRQEKTSILLITYDMGVIWEMCDRVVVMNRGKIVERGQTRDIINNPQDPYTQELITAVPVPGKH